MKFVLVLLFVFGGIRPAQGEETVPEKAKTAVKTTGRQIKKAVNRVHEAACIESDLKCAAKKGKNRVEEAGSAIEDKAVELKDKVD